MEEIPNIMDKANITAYVGNSGISIFNAHQNNNSKPLLQNRNEKCVEGDNINMPLN